MPTRAAVWPSVSATTSSYSVRPRDIEKSGVQGRRQPYPILAMNSPKSRNSYHFQYHNPPHRKDSRAISERLGHANRAGLPLWDVWAPELTAR